MILSSVTFLNGLTGGGRAAIDAAWSARVGSIRGPPKARGSGIATASCDAALTIDPRAMSPEERFAANGTRFRDLRYHVFRLSA